MGFTTRSDIGPAREGPDLELDPQKSLTNAAAAATAAVLAAAVGVGRGQPLPPQQPRPGMGRGARRPGQEDAADDDGEVEKEDLSESNYDAFNGYGGSLFDATTPYDAEDRAADEAYAAVDDAMDGRRRDRREARVKAELSEYRASRPKIQQQFSDLKRGLAQVTAEEWASMPEATDQVRPHKRRAAAEQQQLVGRFTPVPDSVIERARSDSVTVASIAPTDIGPHAAAAAAAPSDLTQIGVTRSKLLDLRLSGISSTVAGQTVIDPKNYLTDLTHLRGIDNSEIGDLKKARLLLKSVRSTNPRNSEAWIGSARLEEYAGQIAQARRIIMEGAVKCAASEDVWLEAARLHGKDAARSILAEAVTHIPRSTKLWLMAADLEDSVEAKRRVLMRALELVPGSVKLWKAAVQLEPPENARVMLGRAVECVPHSADMWLALARLETHENARKVLNAAREKLPTEPSIWINAARLEEANANESVVRTIIRRAVKSLRSHGVKIDRDAWLAEAEAAEKAGSPATCQAIVAEVAAEGVAEADRKRQWREDAEGALSRGCTAFARAAYGRALEEFPSKKSLWLGLAQLEKQHGTRETLEEVLGRAVSRCPKAEVLWLMRAKERWQTWGDVPAARGVLQEAFAQNPDSEAIWLAAVKLESENGEAQRARSLLTRAREACSTERVWRRSAELERDLGQPDEQRRILEESLRRFPTAPKLWALRGALAEKAATGPEEARDVYQRALKSCPQEAMLWVAASRFEESQQTAAARGRARAILETARHDIPKNPHLWLEAIRVEARAGNGKVAQAMMAKALQECPRSGILWAELVETGGAPKSKAVDALKNCEDDAHVILAVARWVFWADHKIDKARSWLTRAVTLQPDLGDAWAALYKFELANGSPQQQEDVLRRCAAAEPRHGDKWRSVSKDPANKRLPVAEILKKVAGTL